MITIPTTACAKVVEIRERCICVRERGHDGRCQFVPEREVWVVVERMAGDAGDV
jgi:hypothetical protein